MKKIFSLKLMVVSFVIMVVAGIGLLSSNSLDSMTKPKTSQKQLIRFESSGTPKVNQPFVVKLVADTGRDNINSVGLYLRFDPSKLIVSEIDTLKSFCQFYPEKKFDNRQGLISLACGSPHPGVRGEAELISITFLPQAVGSSQILIDPKSVLLKSDGKGTNLITTFPSLEVSTGVSF